MRVCRSRQDLTFQYPCSPLIKGERVRVRGDSISHVRKKFPCEPAFLNLITVPLPAVREWGDSTRAGICEL
jgi:hypothetical protein